MSHTELETMLKKRIKRHRIIELALSALFFVLLAVFALLYWQSREVKEVGFWLLKHQTVSYNDNYLWGVLAGVLGLTFSGVFLVSDLLFCKVRTVEVGVDHLTLYRGLARTHLYINGTLQDSLSAFGYYLEGTLSDRSKVNVALSKWSAHLTFSNRHEAVDM